LLISEINIEAKSWCRFNGSEREGKRKIYCYYSARNYRYRLKNFANKYCKDMGYRGAKHHELRTCTMQGQLCRKIYSVCYK
ncbi:hypothetical protein ACFL20_05460, partial [Spirochaetota bacterium]